MPITAASATDGMGGHRLLDLARAQPVPGHVDHVVGATEDVGVAVRVADRPVQRAVQQLLEVAEVAVDVALVVTPHGGQAARRQRRLEHQHALLARSRLLAGGLVDHLHPVARRRQAGRAPLHRLQLQARHQGDRRPAGLGLPVVVDHRHAQAVGEPVRGGLVQRLAGQEQPLQARQVAPSSATRVLLLQHAHAGGRGEHRAHACTSRTAATRCPGRAASAGLRTAARSRRRSADRRRCTNAPPPSPRRRWRTSPAPARCRTPVRVDIAIATA